MTEIQNRLTSLIEETIKVRFDYTIPTFDASVTRLQGSMLDLTERLTQLESLLSQAIRSKAALDRKVALLKLTYQAKWDEAISGKNKRPTFNDYSSSKERTAEANLATFGTQKELFDVEQDQAFAHEAVDITRLHYYGLDKIRQDIRKRLEAAGIELYS